MKKMLALSLAMLLAFSAFSCAAKAEEKKVAVSFYPIYILSMNVFQGIGDIELDIMTAPETGCLHDYQLLAGDMMKLADADALIVCGAGMEPYLQDVKEQFPDLKIIDCSAGIDLIVETHTEDGTEEEEVNAHTWLDAQNAAQIVGTIAESAAALFPEDAEQIGKNADEYREKLQALDAEIKTMLAPIRGEKIVTFHEAFPYFARAYGLEIAAVMNEEHEDTLSPAKLYEVIEKVKAAGSPPLFTEPQYSDAAAYAVSAETGAPIFALDPLASGETTPDAYEKGMLENAETLLRAFGQ